jgi:Fic family protein
MAAQRQAEFQPAFQITPGIARGLMRIEAVKTSIEYLPITPRVLADLRESARLFSTHYSTTVEGNRLTQEQVAQVIVGDQTFPGRERDRAEVRGYYAALDEVERLTKARTQLTETAVRSLHALVMAGGKARVKPSRYRDGQNVIRDSRDKAIVYLRPEAKDVPSLMQQLGVWISASDQLPVPLTAAVAHYQYATVHPYYDGNGCTARLLTTLILHLGGYGLKGLCALDEHYARDRTGYYQALTLGPSHNCSMGPVEADITPWVAYFILGMATSFERVLQQAKREADAGRTDQSPLLRNLETRQRKVLVLFEKSREVTAAEIAALFGLRPRSSAALCQRWVSAGFLLIANPAKKSRRYQLADQYEQWISRAT